MITLHYYYDYSTITLLLRTTTVTLLFPELLLSTITINLAEVSREQAARHRGAIGGLRRRLCLYYIMLCDAMLFRVVAHYVCMYCYSYYY